jgi:hypothetical protein
VVGADFLAVMFLKSSTGFAILQAKIHESNHLHAPTIVPLSHHFPSIWTWQTMFDEWGAYAMSMGVGLSVFLLFCVQQQNQNNGKWK